MKYFRRETFDKVVEAFKGRTLTVKTQVEIQEFMDKEQIYIDCIPGVSKKLIKVLSKMRLTARYLNNMPNWCLTLPDGTQILWNRKDMYFYHTGNESCQRAIYYDYLDLFPEVTMTKELEWLTDNMTSRKFERMMRIFLNCYNGMLDMNLSHASVEL